MAWYNASWLKRKPITLTGGASGAQTDYQVKLTVTWDSDMKTDFSDLRFTKADGTTLIDAWMESHTASTSAVVWVETNTPANTVEADIYMYYGNSGASSDWDITATMIYGDDFEGGNLNKWVKPDGTPAIVANPDGDGNVLYLYDPGGTEEVNSTGVTLAKPFVLEYNARVTPNTDAFVGGLSSAAWASGNIQVVAAGYPNTGYWGYYKGGWTNTGHAFSVNTWYKIIHTRKDSAFDVTEDGTLIVNNVADTNAQTLCLFRSGTNDYAWVDNVFVHKYAANPATYVFGSEETDWYNASWLKRKPITLTGGASGAQTDYQVKLTVTWDSDMKSDFSDLRFTKADGTTLLDSWLESHTASTSAVVWVETNTPANTVEADIYMYYGNSGASSDWDGSATFPALFDDFGTFSGWTTRAGSPGVSGGALVLNNAAVSRAVTFPSDYCVRTKSKYSTSYNIARFVLLDNTYDPNTHSGPYIGWRYTDIMSYDGSWHDGGNCTTDVYDIVEMRNVDDSAHTFDLMVNDVLGVSGTGYRNNYTMTTVGLINVHASNFSTDWILVRKYAANPATYVFGSEESNTSVSIPVMMRYYRNMRNN